MPRFNHESQESINYPRREENIRVDYNITENLRMFARFTQDSDQQIMPYGVGWTSGQNFPLTPTDFKQGPARNASLNLTWVMSNTMTNEFVFGPSQNNLTLDPIDAGCGDFQGHRHDFYAALPLFAVSVREHQLQRHPGPDLRRHQQLQPVPVQELQHHVRFLRQPQQDLGFPLPQDRHLRISGSARTRRPGRR